MVQSAGLSRTIVEPFQLFFALRSFNGNGHVIGLYCSVLTTYERNEDFSHPTP